MCKVLLHMYAYVCICMHMHTYACIWSNGFMGDTEVNFCMVEHNFLSYFELIRESPGSRGSRRSHRSGGIGRGSGPPFHNKLPHFFPRATSEGFLLCTSSAGYKLSFPGRCRRGAAALPSRCRRVAVALPWYGKRGFPLGKLSFWGFGGAWAGP